MNVSHPDLAPAMVGTSTSWLTGFIGVFVAAEPMLQVLALLVSIVVGVLTAIWTFSKIRADAVAAHAAIAAEAVRAQAVVVAAALEESKNGG